MDNDTARKRTKRIRKPKPLRIGCWNVTSLTNKEQEVVLEMERHNIDICALSETKKKGKGNIRMGRYLLSYCGKDKNERAASGVGILIHERLIHNIKDTKYINDRIIQVMVKLNNTKLAHIISVYAPDSTKPREEIDAFYQSLQKTLDSINTHDEIVILGDLNGRIGNDIIPGVKNRFNEDARNENGEHLIQFCAQNEMRINNTFFPHKPQHKYTFENTRGHKSTIDYIITNRNIHTRRILDVRTLSSTNAGTHHGLVLAKITTCLCRQKSEPTVEINKLNIESLSDESTQYLYKNRLKEKIKVCNIEAGEEVETSWRKLKSNILSAAEEALGRRRIRVGGKPNNKPWFTQEIKTLAEDKRKSYLQYRSQSITYEDYKTIRNRINSKIQNIKRGYWEKFSKDMEYDLYGAQKKVWNMLRNRKKPINEYVQTTKITIKEWEDHFRDLYKNTEDNTDNTTEVQNDDSSSRQTYSISKESIRRIINKLKNRKSPGIDEINNELIKYGGEALLEEIHKLFTNIIDARKIPTEWKCSITIPVFKKGAKSAPNNYRGIGLMSSVSKILTKIFEEVISATGLCEEQQGFRRNRSTTDAIFTIRQISEKAIEYNKPAFMCFIDLTQAFDRVKLTDTVPILRRRKIHPNIIQIIVELNTNNHTIIRSNNHLSSRVPMSTGIRQGDSLSPTLFNILMDDIISEVKRGGKGYRMGENEVKAVCYADDVVLVSEDEDNLQRMLYRFEQAASRVNMKISTSKTQCLVISKYPRRCKLAIYNKSVEQVMQFKYLGACITSDRDLKEEVKAQTTKALLISGYLRDIIWRNKHLSIESKTRIYKTCVRPVMTYTIETRAENTTTKRMLRTTEMSVLRAITGISLMQHIRSEEIRDKCEVQDVVRWARARRREWRDHVDRMDDTRLPKIARRGRPRGTRPPGRPPTRWYESWSSASQLRL